VLSRVGIDPDIIGPLRLVPPERRRARVRLAWPSDPRSPGEGVGYRERFRHELVDLGECPRLAFEGGMQCLQLDPPV
jgi:hypothetical protein